MNTNFTKNPIVGTPITPSVIKQIHTAVRRYMPIAGNGIRTSITAGGTIISAIPAPASKKQNDKPLESAGCFAIVAGPIEEPEEGEEIPPTIHFGNRYLQFGNLTLTCDDVEITDADYPTPEPGQDPEVVIAIKATTTAYQSEPTISIVTYDSISEMQEDQHKLDYVIIPLYLLGENFSVQCDFRKQPMAPVGEVM